MINPSISLALVVLRLPVLAQTSKRLVTASLRAPGRRGRAGSDR